MTQARDQGKIRFIGMSIHFYLTRPAVAEVVDGIVFWTKNPTPMLDKLDALRDYMYYFQFTLNSYGADVERNIPSKNNVIIPAFQRLSDLIGPNRVIWRYDPIFLSEPYTMDYHIHYFEELAKRLSPYKKMHDQFPGFLPQHRKRIWLL